jgi:hypothetical protein
MTKSLNLFMKLQLGWLNVFLLGVMADAVYEVIGQHESWSKAMSPLWQYVKIFFLPGTLIILFFYLLFITVTPLRLYLYYYVWIKLIYNTLKRYALSPRPNLKHRLAFWLLDGLFNDYFDGLVLKSFPPIHQNDPSTEERSQDQKSDSPLERRSKIIQAMSYKNKPVLIRREHLMEKSFWPQWAFAVTLLFDKLKITRYQEKVRFRLEVDLCDQSYGIYNNAGKLFLRKTFLDERFKLRCIKKSEKIENFIKSEKTLQNELIIDLGDTPIRWASGGILPIARWNGRYWYVLYFRDIYPVGLNIANGASEAKEEYKNLYSLIYREFSEELILLNDEPNPGDRPPVKQKLFRFPFRPLPEKTSSRIRNGEFLIKHKQLRKEHDNFLIAFDEGPEIRPVTTPFEVRITYHDTNLRDVLHHDVSNVIFNVNPTEFGIEVLLVSTFEMDDEDYLMDGEIWEIGPALVRQPIILLSCDYIQQVFNETKTLGTYIEVAPHLNCKCLEKIPLSEYKIFDKDVDFLRRRLDLLEKDNKTKNSPEVKRYRTWLENYEELFKTIRDSRCDLISDKHRPLTILCPVTWKTLEMICHFNLLNL